MKYLSNAKCIIEGRILGAVRPADKEETGILFQKVYEFINTINRLKDIDDDNLTVIKTNSGIVMSAKQVGDIEIPAMFRPLLLPRSVRFAIGVVPKHPDLKDYVTLGGALQVAEYEIGTLFDDINNLRAILTRNRNNQGSFKINEVWKDQTLSDVLPRVCLPKLLNKQKVWLCNLNEFTSSSDVPFPIINVGTIVSDFNYYGTVEQWQELFRVTFQLPTVDGRK